MADQYIQVPPNSTGAKVDVSELVVGTNTVERQRMVLASPTAAANLADVTAANALKVDGSAVTQPVSGTVAISGTVPVSGTFWQATQPVSAASLPLPSGAATSAKQPAFGIAGTPSSDVVTVQGVASMTALKVDGSAVTQPVSLASTLTIKADIAANQTNALKVDGSATTQPVSIAGTVNTSSLPTTSGGLSATKLVSAATTNATSVKTSAGQLYNVQAFNSNSSSVRFLKIYNKASAPTVGTDTPVAVYLLPAGGGAVVEISNGFALSAGLAFAITAGIADSDATAISANEVLVNLQYK